MKKELIVYINSNEEGEEVRVSRVAGEGQFTLLTLGSSRIVVDTNELMEAVGAIGHYAALFDQEEKIKAARVNTKTTTGQLVGRFSSAPTPVSSGGVATAPVKKSNAKKGEAEGTLELEPELRTGPTASELALQQMTTHMQGGELVIKEKK